MLAKSLVDVDITVLSVDQTLHDGTLSLAEPLSCVPPGRVGQELGELVLGGDVVLEGHVGHLDILAAPLAEELDLGDLGNDGRWGQLLNGLFGPIFSHLDRVFSSEIYQTDNNIIFNN